MPSTLHKNMNATPVPTAGMVSPAPPPLAVRSPLLRSVLSPPKAQSRPWSPRRTVGIELKSVDIFHIVSTSSPSFASSPELECSEVPPASFSSSISSSIPFLKRQGTLMTDAATMAMLIPTLYIGKACSCCSISGSSSETAGQLPLGLFGYGPRRKSQGNQPISDIFSKS